MILSDNESSAHLSYEEIDTLNISGEGELRTGGGFMGGGFGAGGMVAGMAIATVLNALTTTTHVDTVLRVAFDEGELFFHNGEANPRDLRLVLSPVIMRLERVSLVEKAVSGRSPSGNEESLNLGNRLAQIAQLHQQGSLTDDEFRAAKAQVLRGE